MKHLTPTQKAWLAGFIDGEGCLTIICSKTKTKSKVHSYYRPVIVVSNTSLQVLTKIKEMIGCGEIYDRIHIFPNAKLQHALHICDPEDIVELCENLMFYFSLKRDQAKILIEACHNKDRLIPLYEKIHSLNKKGKEN